MATSTKKSASRKKTKTTKPSIKATKTTAKTSKKIAPKKSTTAAKKVTKSTTSTAKKAATASTKQVRSTEATPTKTESVPATPNKLQKLFRWNVFMAVLHAVQAVLVLVLAKPDAGLQTITTNYLTTDTLASTAERPVLVAATRSLFDVNLAWLVAGFFALSAVAHFSIATWYRKKYEADLEKGINKARWIEYSLSASTMMVAIALLAGIYDLGSLVMMFALTAVMNLCGLVMELVNQGRNKVDWSSYIVGCIAGIAPWIVYSFYIVGSSKYGEGGGPPTFVYFILVSIFLFFNSFAINMLLQYRKKGKWANYLYGEKAYMVLSLVAKAALAWQVFAGTLRP